MQQALMQRKDMLRQHLAALVQLPTYRKSLKDPTCTALESSQPVTHCLTYLSEML